jgi:hypothetical protein
MSQIINIPTVRNPLDMLMATHDDVMEPVLSYLSIDADALYGWYRLEYLKAKRHTPIHGPILVVMSHEQLGGLTTNPIPQYARRQPIGWDMNWFGKSVEFLSLPWASSVSIVPLDLVSAVRAGTSNHKPRS